MGLSQGRTLRIWSLTSSSRTIRIANWELIRNAGSRAVAGPVALRALRSQAPEPAKREVRGRTGGGPGSWGCHHPYKEVPRSAHRCSATLHPPGGTSRREVGTKARAGSKNTVLFHVTIAKFPSGSPTPFYIMPREETEVALNRFQQEALSV